MAPAGESGRRMRSMRYQPSRAQIGMAARNASTLPCSSTLKYRLSASAYQGSTWLRNESASILRVPSQSRVIFSSTARSSAGMRAGSNAATVAPLPARISAVGTTSFQVRRVGGKRSSSQVGSVPIITAR